MAMVCEWVSEMQAGRLAPPCCPSFRQPVFLAGPGSASLKLAGRHLAAALIALHLEAQLLAFAERAEARAFDGRDVDENVRAAVVGLDEAKALGGVEPLHG